MPRRRKRQSSRSKQTPEERILGPATWPRLREIDRLARKRPLTLESFTRVQQLIGEAAQLVSFASRPFHSLPPDEQERVLDNAASILAAHGYSPARIYAVLAEGTKRRRGHGLRDEYFWHVHSFLSRVTRRNSNWS